MKIMVSCLLYASTEPIPYASHCQFWYRLGKSMPDVEFYFQSPWRVPIDSARNQSVLKALELGCDYIFFYDNDMILDPETIPRLLARDKPAICGRYTIRGYPFNSAILRFKDVAKTTIKTFEPTEEEIKQGIVQVDAVGAGACLLHTDIFKQVSYPWFFTGSMHTEDVYFFLLAAQVPGFSVWCDLTLETGHMTEPIIVHSKNRDALKEFYAEGNAVNFFPLAKD